MFEMAVVCLVVVLRSASHSIGKVWKLFKENGTKKLVFKEGKKKIPDIGISATSMKVSHSLNL